MEDCVLICQVQLFIVGTETILCNSEHNNVAVDSKISISSSVSIVWQLSLHTGEGCRRDCLSCENDGHTLTAHFQTC